MRRTRPLILAAMLAAGCASAPKTVTPAGPPTIERMAAAAFTAPTVAPAALLPAEPLTGVYLRTTPGKPPRELPYRVERPGDREWVVVLEGRSRSTYRLDDDGNLRVVREEDVRQDASVTYDPGLVVLPAAMDAGAAVEATSLAVVHTLSGERKRDQGPVVYRTEVLGRATIATAAGPRDVAVVSMQRRMDLGLAKVRVDLMRAWEPGLAIVAEAASRDIQALGLLRTGGSHVLERAAEPSKVGP